MTARAIVAWCAVVACGDAAPTVDQVAEPAAPPLPPLSAARTAELAIKLTDLRSDPKLRELVHPKLIASTGESLGSPPLFGRDAYLAKPPQTKCTLELVLAAAGRAVTVRTCAGSLPVKVEPRTRPYALRMINELELAPEGTLRGGVMWRDAERLLAQVGVPLDADPTPDTPAEQREVVVADGHQREPRNEAAAREIMGALDRRDVAVLERRIANGYRERSIHRAAVYSYANVHDYAIAATVELAACDASAYRINETFAAGAWVVVRLGRSCRAGDHHVYSNQLWLMRFDHERLVEGIRATPHLDEEVQRGFDPMTIERKMVASGLF